MPLVATAFLAATLLGAPSGWGLRWEAPAECPDSAEVQRAFDQHAKPGGEPVDAVGRVTRTSTGYLLTLQLRNATSEDTRVIEAPSCDALAETAGLLIAVASESAGSAESFVPEPEPVEPQPETELEPSPLAKARTEPTRPTAPRSEQPLSLDAEPALKPHGETARLRFALGVEGQVQALRLLPQMVGGGVSASAAVLGADWRAELRAGYLAPQTRDYPDVAVGGAFDLWTIGAAGCWEPHRERLSVPLCGGVEAGSLRGRTQTVDEPGRAGAFFAGLTADATLMFAPIPRLALTAGLGGVVSARRPRFHVRDRDTLFRAGPGALRSSLGVEVRFP